MQRIYFVSNQILINKRLWRIYERLLSTSIALKISCAGFVQVLSSAYGCNQIIRALSWLVIEQVRQILCPIFYFQESRI